MNELEVIETKQALDNMAEMLAAYRESLLTNGFLREEAMDLVGRYQTQLLVPSPVDLLKGIFGTGEGDDA